MNNFLNLISLNVKRSEYCSDKNYAKWRWTASSFIIGEAQTDHLTHSQIQFSFLFVVHYPIVPCRPRQNHTDRGCSSLHMVRSPPCLYRSAKQIKALSQITYQGTYTIQGQGQSRPSL